MCLKLQNCDSSYPGGGYLACEVGGEGYPVAAEISEMGYTAFVLEYRVGENAANYAPFDDLARAIEYINANAEHFNVETENYALLGFSAGGNLVSVFGSEAYGYRKYGLNKPGALLLGYPLVNVLDEYKSFSFNIWGQIPGKVLAGSSGLSMMDAVIGKNATYDQLQVLCAQLHVTKNYPPTYIFAGTADFMVPIRDNEDLLADALKKNNITYEKDIYRGISHGVGIAVALSADGWLDTAITFWQTNIKSK